MIPSRHSVNAVGLAAAALAAVALAVANFVGSNAGENGGGREYALTLAVSLAVAVALFGLAIPRIERPERAGLLIGVLAVLSVAAFWSGLPYVLGPAAVVLGLRGRAREEGRTAGALASGLGALATVGAIAALLADQVL